MQFNKTTVLVCDCNGLMIPNISTGDAEGYGWICLNPSCPEFNGLELASEDLEAVGVPPWVAELIANYFEHLEGNGAKEQPCPNHEGGYDCTPFCDKCAGNQFTLNTYTVLTGTTYEVEATTEEEALNRFHAWYSGEEEADIEEGEALTIIYQ